MSESLFLNKIKADLNDKPITRKIQISEVSEVAERKSSFSYTISLPKTSRNIQLFDMLGTIGNTSRKPYEAIVADYVVDNIYLVLNGSAIIRETSDSYQLNIIDGIRSLSETLKDKKLIDLPLEDLNHIITSQSFIDSFQNTEGFIYGIANYGRGASSSSLKIEKHAPSIFTHTLFRRIFESNGLSCQGEFFTTNEKYLSEVLTPSRGYSVEFGTLQSTQKGGAQSNQVSDYKTSNEFINFEKGFTMTNAALIGASVVAGNIVFTVAGTYKLDLSIAYGLYRTYASILFQLNGSSKSYIYLEEGNSLSKLKEITFAAEVGDVVSFKISGGSSFDYENPEHQTFMVNYSATIDASLYLQEGGQVVKASDYIGDMTQLEFIKDVVNRYGLVLHPVQNTGEFKFKRLEALLNDRLTAEDWTSKLSEIDGEKYVSGYAKANKANYSYPEATVVPTHDGQMNIQNENADTEKPMFSSPFEIPVKSGSVNGEQMFLIPVWGEENQGTIVVETDLNNDGQVSDCLLLTNGNKNKLTPSNLIADFFIHSNGALVANGGFDVDVYPVQAGNLRRLVGKIYSSYAYIAKWAFYEDSACTTLVSVGGVFPTTPDEYSDSITVPANANFIGVTRSNFYARLYEGTNDGSLWNVYTFNNIDPINKTYKATGSVNFTGSAFVCFYDINDTFISYYIQGYNSLNEYEKSGLYIPTNCTTIRVSGYDTQIPKLYEYETAEYITAVNEETPLKIMHVNRLDKPVTAYFYNEVTGVTASTNVPYLNLDFISMQYFLGNFYKAFQNMIENYKKVSLKVNLSTIDIFNLDFFRLKFLKQTGRFYYLNSVQHTAGKISSVEAIEIKEFPTNQPPSQIGSFSFNMGHGSSRTVTLANLSTGYEDPELDIPLKIKIISGFNADILLKQNGVTINAETEINASALALTAVEVLGGLDAYSKSWVFAIADAGSGSYGLLTGTLTANVLETVNQPPVANAGTDQNIVLPLPEVYNLDIFVSLNGSASYDYTGEIVSYVWSIISSPAGSIVDLIQSFSSPFASLEGENIEENLGNYTLRLTVTDEFGLTDTDDVQVNVSRIHI